MACHEVYSDELAGRKWGYALWSPDPVPREVQGHTNHQQLPVSLGDVGFVRDGGFTPLFNVHLPSDDPHQSRYLPDNFVHISKPRLIRDDWLKKGMRVSRRVRVGGMDINVPQGIAPLTGQASFSCNRTQGAVLVIPEDARRKDAHSVRHYKDYMLKNCESWLAFANGPDSGLDLGMEDLILVTGYDLASSWAVAAFMHSETDATIELQVNTGIGAGGAGMHVSWKNESNAEHNWGPTPMDLMTSGSVESTLSPRVSQGPTSTDNHEATCSSGNGQRESLTRDQCIFLRGYHVKRRVFRTVKKIRAMAGPSDLPEERDGNSDVAVPSTNETQTEEDMLEVSPIGEKSEYKPLVVSLLDYILDNSDASIAIVHDKDFELFDDAVCTPSDIRRELSGGCLSINVQSTSFSQNVGMLSSEPTDRTPDRRHHRQPIESSVQREQELAPQDPPDAMQQLFTLNYASFKPSINLQRLIVPLQHWAQLGNVVMKDPTYLDDKYYEGRPRMFQIYSAALHALLIGINAYQSPNWSQLKGALNDVDAIYAFLTEDLKVPPSNIKRLTASGATGAAILHELKALASNPSIKSGDPMLIYYAGHGFSGPPPAEWMVDDAVMRYIVPYDYSSDTQAMPYMTITACLDGIAKSKGNNITVILDCSSCSYDSNYAQRTRYVDLPTDVISPTLDKEPRGPEVAAPDRLSRGSTSAPEFHQKGLESHVLLAASGLGGIVQEVHGRGVFTRELIEALKKNWRNGVTYKELISVLELQNQHPQCVGINKNRQLFTTKVIPVGRVPLDSKPYSTIITTPTGSIIIRGASPRGKSLYEERHYDIKVEFGEGLDEVTENLILSTLAGSDSRRTVPSEIPNALLVSPGGTDITFDAVSKPYSKFGFKRLPHTIPHNEYHRLNYVLPAALNFYGYLYRQPLRGGSVWRVVEVKFTELKEMAADGHLAPQTFRPSSENLINGDNEVHLGISTTIKRQYGIKITNISDSDLYPTLFYFDNSDFSIQSYFLPPSSTHGGIPDPPLRAGQSLTIGYGSSRIPPLQYYLNEGQNVGVGFLKLFLTSTYVDLSRIAQESPFLPEEYVDLSSIEQESPFLAEDRGGKALLDIPEHDRTMSPNNPWFVHTIPIVQTRE